MKILTLNTWQERGPWEDRWEVILKGLGRYQPDVVAFQETFNGDWMEKMKQKAEFPYLVFPHDQAGLSLFSKFPIDRWEWMTMETQSPTEDYMRYVLYAELGVREHRLAVLNTHLSWKLGEGSVREDQVHELIGFAEKHAGDMETIVMGDFNTPPGTPEIQQMEGDGKFTDTFAAKHPESPGLTWDNANPYAGGSGTLMPDRRIDYIFVRNQSEVLRDLVSVDLVFKEPDSSGVYATDHFGVMASFRE